MQVNDAVALEDALLALAMVGDLSMGQPIDQSRRTARLAQWLVQASGGDQAQIAAVRQVALLRWSGCTANAEGFMRLLGDDVGGRRDMLAHTLDAAGRRAMLRTTPLAVVHCEVAGEVARTLALGSDVEHGLRHIFECYDGSGRPLGLRHPDVPQVVYQVVLAGDLEILSRAHGLEAALEWIVAQGDRRYPAALVAALSRHATDWLQALRTPEVAQPRTGPEVPLTLVGDVIDLKLPWLAGYSRQAANLVRDAGRLWGLPEPRIEMLAKAALIHGLGRAAVPNRVWSTPGPLLDGDLESVRLVPYWTHRACSQIDGLNEAGQLAAHAYERLDGSGYFRALGGEALQAEHRLLSAALAWQALRAERPWRAALDDDQAARLLQDEAEQGRFDLRACQAVISAAHGEHAPLASKAGNGLLSERETQILQRISGGASNKAVARDLGISPSTVRTHVESVFRKLQCSTRAAATLKALTLGVI
ncbi:HD domain-containing phosphohydrolase [Pseudomonas sp. UBA7530]|uniref:HD domain-containing phosphohydrolase n=1 Tax=Pseudomonas sp. UBA7530 TaxID=1947341 RepID=UPI0025F605B2|nr:HD domain-containing phosphohydrolase [Pseudomonas sp. UBA7530]